MSEAIDGSLVDEAVDGSLVDEAVDGSLVDEAVDGSLVDEAGHGSLVDEAVDATLVEAVRLAEAMIFASAEPVVAAVLARMLSVDVDVEPVVAALQAQYAGRGVELVEAGGGWQFRTAADLAPALTRTVQQKRRLPRAAMETLAVVAYHQPVTRTEIEEIRGASLGQAVMEALLEDGLITPLGRKEVPGRPTLWGTTPAFLAQFGLRDVRELPLREDLLRE